MVVQILPRKPWSQGILVFINLDGLVGARVLLSPMATMTAPNISSGDDLPSGGWRPLPIRWLPSSYDHHLFGRTRKFDVVADVPRSAGLYVFGVDLDASVDVRYVGQSSHLWMVTKGRLPGGQARPGQRYGRPKWSGATRQRINAALTEAADAGRTVRMWVKTIGGVIDIKQALDIAEGDAISRWELCRYGLNRR
jgi:hypothetical protein